MNALNRCPTCQSELAEGGLDGLCLRCLGRLGFADDNNVAAPEALLRLGDYDLLEEIARGGMGVVYRARQLSLDRIVALKVVLHGPFASPDFVQRFRHEARAIAALRHPHIVAIHEIGEHNGSHFISLEFVEGQSFAQLARDRPLSAGRAAGYVKQMADAVEHAHEHGVLHRDLKPSNILLDAFDQPRITDFGLAKLVNQDGGVTLSGQTLGSPNYMPPEQAAGKPSDPRADVYSLGAILYELLTGRPPFLGESVQSVLAQVENAEPVPPRRLNPGVPVDLQTICLKCLQKNPARRYASARELAEDLDRFLDSKPVLARPVGPGGRLWRWSRRRPLVAALSLGVVGTLTLGIAGVVWEWRQAELHALGESRQRQLAEQTASDLRLNAYAADVALASRAIQSGDFGLARRTLDALKPQPGQTDLRGFEWRYLRDLCEGDQLATLRGHQGTVACATFSPDARLLATGSQDGCVIIWDVARRVSLDTIRMSGATNSVWSLAFTPDGKYLMAGCNAEVGFWDTTSWRPWKNFPGRLAALSLDGSLLATVQSSPFFWEPPGPVKIWNWQTGQMLRQVAAEGRAVAFSPDGQFLAVAGPRSGIRVYRTATGELCREWPTQTAVWSLNFSPDGARLLSAGWSTEVSEWNLTNDAPPRILSGHQLHVWSAVFSPDGGAIATASSDQTLRLWDAKTFAPIAIDHGHDSEVWCAAFSPDGNLLATGGKDQLIQLWPARPHAKQRALPNDNSFIPSLSPDGKWLAAFDPIGGDAVLLNASNGSVALRRPFNAGPFIGFSPDGKNAVAIDDGTLVFLDPRSGQTVRQTKLQGPGPVHGPFVCAGMSSNQAFLFCIDTNGGIRVWDTASGALAASASGPAPPTRNAILSPDARHLALSLERENFARLYNFATGSVLELTGHRDFVSGLAFSPDSATLATGSMDGSIRLWDTRRGRPLAVLPGHMQETTDLAFSPDGRTLASVGAQESLKLWHVPTRREVVSQSMPHAGHWLRFSADGSTLAVENDSDQILLLSAPPGQN